MTTATKYHADHLTGSLLLAMPGMSDQRFDRSVIFMCSHDESGAMGLVINDVNPKLSFSSLLNQLNIKQGNQKISIPKNLADQTPIHRGGPVEPGRGFVLHSADYAQASTMTVRETHALTATVDVLKAIANGRGPLNHLVALGYAGWRAGQLEREITSNSWMIADAEDEIIFNTELDQKWPRAMAMLGIDISMLSLQAGHA